MNKPIHGGGVDRAMLELGLPREQILDFSASINPLGTPPEVTQALASALERIGDYPEIDASSLRDKLARHHKISQEHLLPGSGSIDLIYLLPRVFKPRRALLVQPCFSEYAPALQQVGCRIDTVSLSPDNEFSFSVEKVHSAVAPETDLVMLANPGNPTGVGIDPQQLLALADRLGDCRLLVDEAFVDFCPERSLLKHVTQRSNLLVLRSMTKFYSIPGLRVGYLAASMADTERVDAMKEPWSLSNLAIAAGKACLRSQHYRQQTLQRVAGLRAQLQIELERLQCQVFPGEANYLLVRLPPTAPTALELKQTLYQQGVLIRSCDDFPPLDERYLRVAVLSGDANLSLLAALQGYFQDGD